MKKVITMLPAFKPLLLYASGLCFFADHGGPPAHAALGRSFRTFFTAPPDRANPVTGWRLKRFTALSFKRTTIFPERGNRP